MLDLTQAREDFLSAFPSQYQEHILEFSRKLSSLDVDVLILTARKAVCLFHCLELLGIFKAGSKLVISERWMEHDRKWLAGKRIAIVDEVIVTGTSIYKLCHELEAIGVQKVEVHCLFINGDYFVEDFFKKINLSRAYIKLDGEEAQALSTAIVEAMYQIPRPYSVDYPMSTWLELKSNGMDRLIALPGWHSVERHWMDSRGSSSRRRTTYFRITPRKEMASDVDAALGANVFERSIVKIRLYGAISGKGENQRYDFRIVPYVVLGELQLSELERVFVALISDFSLANQQTIVASCATEESRLRLVQYVLSSRLATYWSESLSHEGVSSQFRQDIGELTYIFPTVLHQQIQILSRPKVQRMIDIVWPDDEGVKASPQGKSSSSDVPLYFELVKPFKKLYEGKELKLRRLALEMGEKIFTSPKYRQLVQRLKTGYSFESLVGHARKRGVSLDHSTLSDFLDLAIDTGVVVPITSKRRVRGQTMLYRAYRHGEETYILTRDLALFHAMLRQFSQTWLPDFRSSTNDPMPRIMVEKLLVLFLRYTIGGDILRASYERLDGAEPDLIPLNVGFHKHGARLSTGYHDPTEFLPDQAFVNLLSRENILRKVKSGA